MSTNLNELAKKVTLAEGKKINLSIGQVKEVIRLTLIELASLPMHELTKILVKYQKEIRGVKN
jgi:predicted DNA-binding antitoxin AbrB/MazE fold protein